MNADAHGRPRDGKPDEVACHRISQRFRLEGGGCSDLSGCHGHAYGYLNPSNCVARGHGFLAGRRKTWPRPAPTCVRVIACGVAMAPENGGDATRLSTSHSSLKAMSKEMDRIAKLMAKAGLSCYDV